MWGFQHITLFITDVNISLKQIINCFIQIFHLIFTIKLQQKKERNCNRLTKVKVQGNTTWEYHNWQSPIGRDPVPNYKRCICHQNEVLAVGRYFYPQRLTMSLSTCSWFLSQLAKSIDKRKSGKRTVHIIIEKLVLNVVFVCWIQIQSKVNWKDHRFYSWEAWVQSLILHVCACYFG